MWNFARRVIDWQRRHGRHDLPWQQARDAYAIWVSEIMLQQTQVSTVIPYYTRFMRRFPDVRALAQAPLDDVLAQWSGLGYYSRARHLHDAARVVCLRHNGIFPDALEEASALPGIGRSTAAAILVFSYGARHAILDGNVKRVLARCFAIRGYPGERDTSATLWRQAEAVLPTRAIEAYTQGLMDLGALVCTRHTPQCAICPLRSECRALKADRVHELPAPRPRKVLPRKSAIMLLLQDGGDIFLEKRPPTGIWGGLWCFPEIRPEDDVAQTCAQRYGARVKMVEPLPPIEHGFTHFRLTITPQHLHVTRRSSRAAEPGQAWWPLEEARAAGVPSPVRRILDRLNCGSREEGGAKQHRADH